MGSKKYPLSALVDVRRDQADAATRELGAAIRTRESKEAELRAAQQRTVTHADQVAEGTRQERAALEQGALRAVDLLRHAAWQLQQEREAEELAHGESRSAAALHAAADAETRARTGVAAKLGELQAVERDRERFTSAQKQAALAQEEEAAEEAWRPR